MKTLIIAIHGFNTDGEYINKLAPYFVKAGYDFQPYIYGKAARTTIGNIIANRFRTKKIFNDLAQIVINSKAQEVILLGHSHGLRLAWAVQNVCGNVVGVIGFNGALDTHVIEEGEKLPLVGCTWKSVPIKFRSWVINCYCPTDYTLKIGARFRPFHKWGCYGAVENESAHNINLSKYGVKGHSDFLDHLDEIMPDVIRRVKVLAPPEQD